MLSLTNKFEDIKYYGTETVRNGPRGKRPNLIFNRTFVAMDHFVPEYKYSTIAVPDMVVGDNSQCNVNAIFHLSFVFSLVNGCCIHIYGQQQVFSQLTQTTNLRLLITYSLFK